MARTKSPATPRAKPWGHATLLQLLIDLKSKQLEHLCFILHVSGKSGAPQLGVEFWETSGGRADYKFAYRHAGAYIDALWSDHRGVLTQAGTSKDERREMPAIVKADGSGLVAGVKMMDSTTGNFSEKRCGKVNGLQFHVIADGTPWSGTGSPKDSPSKQRQATRGLKRERDSASGAAGTSEITQRRGAPTPPPYPPREPGGGRNQGSSEAPPDTPLMAPSRLAGSNSARGPVLVDAIRA